MLKSMKKTKSKSSKAEKQPTAKKTIKKAVAKKTKALPKKATKAEPPVTGSKLLAKRVAEIASDHKANDIVVLSLSNLTSFTDYFVICSGNSDRQVSSIADAIRHEVKKTEGRLPFGEEGMSDGRWALIDYGEVVAHVFYRDVRDVYQLERLWHDAPRVKFAGVTK